MNAQQYKVTDMMTLAPDGMYHGLTGDGREIVVSPAMIAATLALNVQNEEEPGQGHFWTHDPEA